jgi:hypothetical protein
MALKSWLASLKADVSNVSGVQALIHAGLGRYVTETEDVSGVSGSGGMVASDTADTVWNMQTYQAQPTWALACTVDTADTCRKSKADIQTTEATTTPTQIRAKRVFRHRGPWLTVRQAGDAKAYHLHHFNCPQCIATGRGARYGGRCAVGLALWNDYTEADYDG